MRQFRQFGLKTKKLLDLNEFIHHKSSLYSYHLDHIYLVKRYSLLMASKLHLEVDPRKFEYIALAHDLFKERSLNPRKVSVQWRGHNIPQDTNRYVRMNLDILSQFLLDEYFNTDIQLHPLASAIFLIKELGVADPEILYPIMFHSCPIFPVYTTLNSVIRDMVDIVMLADKMSSNHLRINMREVAVRVDLDQIVFGSSGKEFNYTLGLLIARLISQGSSKETQSALMTEHYYNRLKEVNPLIANKCHIQKLGESKKWPKRNSQVLKLS